MGGSSQDTDLNGMHIRRVTPARSRILNGGDSSIELLRIIAGSARRFAHLGSCPSMGR